MKHYLPLLERKGRAIFYAKPVQDNLPASFLEWLSSQSLSPKELTEILLKCTEYGWEAVMTESCKHTAADEIKDTVVVQTVDLHAYDVFLERKAGVNP